MGGLTKRMVVGLFAILFAIAGVVVLRASRPEQPSPTWQAGEWYQLDDSNSNAECELPAVAGRRYLLVIGCQGDAADSHAVRWHWTKPNKHGSMNPRSISISGVGFRRSLNSTAVADRIGFGERQEKTSRSHTRKELLNNSFNRKPEACVGSGITTYVRAHASGLRLNEQPPDQRRHQGRDVFLHVTDGDLDDPKQYVQIATQVVAVGSRVQVLLDRQVAVSRLPTGLLDELLETLEAEVLPTIESRFGEIRDVDQDGRFSIVLTPWLSRLQGGKTSINGMVRSSDFRMDVPTPIGNRGDMLLLNSNLPRGSALRDLLFHEVTHAACISQRLPQSFGPFIDEHDWLSEALAHLSEPSWSNIEDRLVSFLDDPAKYPLVVPDYYRAGLWRNSGCRGATYLFARWCVDQHGPDLCRRLAQSSDQGTQNLEHATSRRFEDLFRNWTLAVATDTIPSVELIRSLGRRNVAGVRRFVGHSTDEVQSQTLRGTSFTVIELQTDDVEHRTLCLKGDSTANWQYSLCRLPDELPDIQLKINEATFTSSSDVRGFGLPKNSVRSLQVEVSDQDENVVVVEQLICDRKDSEPVESLCLNPQDLNSLMLSEFSTESCSVYRFPIERMRLSPGTWSIKAVVRNEAGLRSAAWADVEIRSPNETAVMAKATTAAKR